MAYLCSVNVNSQSQSTTYGAKENRAIHPDPDTARRPDQGLYRATSARPQNTKMYMGIFALLYYIIMGIQSEPLKTGKDDELKSRTDG